MAARHLAEDFFSEEQEDDYQSAYATAAQGKHLRKPAIQYVPTIPEDYRSAPPYIDVQANAEARDYVEEIYRELADATPSRENQTEDASQGIVLRSARLSDELLPGFGPPQSQLSQYIPDIESIPDNWNQTTSGGVFARHQSASSTLVLDQEALHGLRRRLNSRDHGQVEGVAGYYAPQTTPSGASASTSAIVVPQKRKGLLAAIAEFFARLFHRNNS